jgi:hypothetical protein
MKVKNSTMQAFPFIEPHEDESIKAYHPGMTMRDEFAKAAMQSYLNGDDRDSFTYDEWAKASYQMADAMMKARK